MILKSRKALLAAAAAALAIGTVAVGMSGLTSATAAQQVVEVWKAATCDCCAGWIKHMQAAGFSVTVHELENVEPVKAANGVPQALGSCHTGVVDGYVLEGHVPAADVKRLLAERPAAKGLSVPGMPQDAPGMDGKSGQPYDVVLFGGIGGNAVYARH